MRTSVVTALTMSVALGAAVLASESSSVAALGDSVLFVSGQGDQPPIEDRRVIELIESNGLDVVVVDDEAVSRDDAADVDAVVISSSIVPGNVGAEFVTAPIPVVVWEPYLFTHMKMTRSGGSNRGEITNMSSVDIVRADHPLAAGLSGSVGVTERNVIQTWGRVEEGGVSIASAPGSAAKSTVFVYDAGTQMVGITAVDTRIGLFPSFDTGDLLTGDGAALLMAAVDYAVGRTSPTPVDEPGVPTVNARPFVSAGADITVDHGRPITVAGTASDDGLPVDPGRLTTLWTGPPGVSFGSPESTTSTVTVSGPGTYRLVLTATDGASTSSDTMSLRVHAVDPGDPNDRGGVLYIAASTTGVTGEQPVIQRLEDAGHTVTIVDDNDADPAAAGDYDLVYVSASIAPTTFDDAWADAATPIVVAEPYVFDDLGFTPNNIDEGAASGQRDVKITTSDHPITSGFDGTVRVTTSGRSISWARPGGDVRSLAAHNWASDKVALFTYEQGAALFSGTAPARRAGVFLAADAAPDLTADGWELFDRTIAWAMATPQPAPTAAISADITTGQAPQTVRFSSSGSTGDIVDFAWDFGNGFMTTGPAPVHTFTRGGIYEVVLTVTDADAQSGTASLTLDLESAAPIDAGDEPIVRYDFVRSGDNRTVRDTSGVGDPIDLTVAAPGAVTWLDGGGLAVDSSTKIQSTGPATKIIDAVTATGAITVETWIDPANTKQDGPARIVTLSNGDDERDSSNLMIGQGHLYSEGDRVEARFRTSSTTRHGTPGVVSRAAAIDGGLVHLVASRDSDGRVTVFVNGTVSTEWQISGDLSVWDPTTPLILANEHGENRPWRGRYHLVQIYNRALSQAEVCGNLAAGPGRSPGGNVAPFACLEVRGDGVDAPATVQFDGVGSTDIDGAVVGWSWDFGDGSTGSGRSPRHLYSDPGEYDVALTVTDMQGRTRTATVTIELTDPTARPAPTLQDVSGMRVGNGFFKEAAHVARETWLGREMNWTSQFTDHRSASRMGSSSNGLFASRNAQLPDVVDRMNVTLSVGLAFGDEDLNNGGRLAVARNLQKTLDGEYDFLYFRVASRAKDAGFGDAIIRLGHEFNGKWPPWASRGSEQLYIQAYRHVHDLFQNVSPDFRFDWTAMKNDWADTAPQAYPGDDYVDIVGLSVYWKGAGKVWDEAVWRQQYLRPMRDARDFAISRGKQVGYPEWGILRRNEPLFIDRMHDFFVALPKHGAGSMAYNVYWDSGTSADRLDAVPLVKQRYRQLFG